MKPHARLRSPPEMYAASKPPPVWPAATAETMSPPNCGAIAGRPGSLTKWISPAAPSVVRVTFCSFAAKASAGGPIAADALKLR